jgi:NADPH:quinone reductase-like Zn-dependent oxidoreductase
VIASSVPDFRPGRQAIGKYLRAIGVMRDSMSVPSIAPLDPVSAELFDLSDTARLRLATAASIPFTPDTLHALCFDWVYPTAGSTAALPR